MSTPAELLGALAKKQKDPYTFTIDRTNIVQACEQLRSGGFEHLCSITAVDWQTSWEIIYHLVQYGRKEVVALHVTLPYQDPTIPSVTSVWAGAGWHERESYDLMGIKFIGNADLRRILLPEDFDGHPLRKSVVYGNRS